MQAGRCKVRRRCVHMQVGRKEVEGQGMVEEVPDTWLAMVFGKNCSPAVITQNPAGKERCSFLRGWFITQGCS